MALILMYDKKTTCIFFVFSGMIHNRNNLLLDYSISLAQIDSHVNQVVNLLSRPHM